MLKNEKTIDANLILGHVTLYVGQQVGTGVLEIKLGSFSTSVLFKVMAIETMT